MSLIVVINSLNSLRSFNIGNLTDSEDNDTTDVSQTMSRSKRANRNNSSSKKGQGVVKEDCCSCYKGDGVGDDWIHCHFCDGWFHENCPGLPEVISQISQAKCCSFCLENKKVEETTQKVIKDTIQGMLPSIGKTVLEQPNLGELSRAITKFKLEDIETGSNNDKHREKRSPKQ